MRIAQSTRSTCRTNRSKRLSRPFLPKLSSGHGTNMNAKESQPRTFSSFPSATSSQKIGQRQDKRPLTTDIDTLNEQPRVILSGIQPTGIPHLGNYLGALRPWAQLQHASPPGSKLLYSLVDLHSLTGQLDADRRRQCRWETLAAMLAVGIDPDRAIVFCQSAVGRPAWLVEDDYENQ